MAIVKRRGSNDTVHAISDSKITAHRHTHTRSYNRSNNTCACMNDCLGVQRAVAAIIWLHDSVRSFRYVWLLRIGGTMRVFSMCVCVNTSSFLSVFTPISSTSHLVNSWYSSSIEVSRGVWPPWDKHTHKHTTLHTKHPSESGLVCVNKNIKAPILPHTNKDVLRLFRWPRHHVSRAT